MSCTLQFFYVGKTWCMLQVMLRYLGWYWIVCSWCLTIFLMPWMFVFFLGLFFFRSILDGSQYLEKINTHFYVWETSSFQSFIVCFGNVKESLSLRKLILDCKNNGTSSFHWVMTKNNNSVLDSGFTVGCYGSVAT